MWVFCTFCIKNLGFVSMRALRLRTRCVFLTKGIPLRINKPPTLHTSTEVIPSVGVVFHLHMEKMCKKKNVFKRMTFAVSDSDLCAKGFSSV